MLRDISPLRRSGAANLQSEGDIVAYRPMRQKRELLEDHCGLVAAELHEIRLVHLHDVDVVYEHFTNRRIDQPVDMPDQS